jgi:hypothetical protein
VCFIFTVHISTHMFFYLYLIRIQAHFHSLQASHLLSGLYCQIKFKLALWNWKTDRTKCALNCFIVRIQLDTFNRDIPSLYWEACCPSAKPKLNYCTEEMPSCLLKASLPLSGYIVSTAQITKVNRFQID